MGPEVALALPDITALFKIIFCPDDAAKFKKVIRVDQPGIPDYSNC